MDGGGAVACEDLRDRTEEELLREAQRGSSPCFGAVTQRYRATWMGVLARRGLPVHDAEDVVQETFARAYVALGSYDPARPFGAWLTTIALRVAATHRRRRREAPADDVERSDPAPAPPEAVAGRQERENLWVAARQALPPRQYEAVCLRYAHALSVREIAAAMRMSSTHVRVLLHRARRALLRLEPFRRANGEASGRVEDGGVP